MEDLEAMRMKAIRDAQARTRMELMASNPPPRPPQPSERERDEAHRLLAEQMVQRSLSMQVEALRRREVMKHQMILQRQVENERAKMEEEEEATVAGGITNGAIADAAVVETGQSDDTVRGDATEYSYSIASPHLPKLTRSPQPTHHSPRLTFISTPSVHSCTRTTSRPRSRKETRTRTT
jgi:hypothetical protein